jgi:lipopolysaccharide transport system ATP-binding protein
MSNASDIVIRVEGLGKRYRYGDVAPLSTNLRADITDWAKALFRRSHLHHRTLRQVHEQHIADSPEYFWALKDINLEIKRGEVVGIIGRNGAGKSTLLKILSRITLPTTGRITYNGRIASLLEVGTGFHRELTGRENIYLNGSILGMKRAEIARKLDEIIAFAEVEKFIDTPVKFYSSGMYVRLAFAVAAHLESEILIVDEVLAVGDAPFQKKCLGKMGDVAKGGRTILFVSHNMAAVQSLCCRAALLVQGEVTSDGNTDAVIRSYLQESQKRTENPIRERNDRGGQGPLRFTGIAFLTDRREPRESWPCGVSGCVALKYQACVDTSSLKNAHVGFSISGFLGEPLFQCWTRLVPDWPEEIPSKGVAYCFIPQLPIKPGLYTVNLYSEVGESTSDWVVDAAQLLVSENDFFGTGKLPQHSSYFLVAQAWGVGNPDNT